jgi:adenine-specific DNA-methyltransferase
LFAYSLAEIGLSVSTGPVVDFRLRRHLHADPAAGAVPLLYSHHFAKGILNWPKEHRKPNSIAINDETKRWLIPQGWYVLTKRFSSKEEKKRIVSFVLDPSLLPFELYGIENHLNFIHQNKAGLDPDVARGLAVFLNSTLIDQHFRTFSGHTQVNATDLRNMKFPSLATLTRLGCWAKKQDDLTQDMIDQHIGSLDG